jgi:hypothetical protein
MQSAPTDVSVEELIIWAHDQLGLGENRPWRLVAAWTKLKKVLFEIEELSPEGPVRLIGKVARPGRGERAFQALSQVWDAGFRPPHPFTVVRPVAWLPARNLLLQEKAPGVQLAEPYRSGAQNAPALARCAAKWVAALHSLPLLVEPWERDAAAVARWREELSSALPAQAGRIVELCDRVAEGFGMSAPLPLVPSHGDFHPMNLFMTGDRVTAIDFDMFGARERSADVAYHLAQTAIMGYLRKGTFEASVEVREAFFNAYRESADAPPHPERLEVYTRAAYLQSLHFELCVLHTGNMSIVEPWLQAAERCLA